MPRMRTHCILLLLGVLAALSTATPAVAQTNAGDVSVYVSDQFKTVASRVLTQLTVGVIQSACPKDQVLCTRVVKRLADAFSAALTNNKPALTTAIEELFVETTVAGSLQLSIGPLSPDHEGTDTATKKLVNDWRYGVPPMLNCVVSTMSGHDHSDSCKVSKDNVGWITNLFDDVANAEHLSRSDQENIATAWSSLAKRGRLDPVTALKALATLAGSKTLDLPEKRVYLLTLEELVAEGLGSGLAPAAYAYLANVGNLDDPITALTDVLSGNPPYAFLMPAQDMTTRATLQACGIDALKIYDAWLNARNGGNIFARWRQEALQGEALDLTAFAPLVDVAANCFTNNKDPKAASALFSLHEGLEYFKASLATVNFTSTYALPTLAGASLLDFVRTRDTKALEKNMRSILVYGAAQASLYVANRNTPQHPIVSSIRDVLRTCEFQGLEQALGLPPTVFKPAPSLCYSVLEDAPDEETPSDTCPPTTKAQRCPTHQAPVPKTVYTVADITAALQGIEQRLKPLESNDRALRDVVTGLNVNELARALADLEAGDTDGAERELVRLGIDFMVDEVDDLAASFTTSNDDSACTRDARSRSIFSGLGAACAVRLLLQAAYRPIADWYFQQGPNSTTESTVATTVYRNLLDSPALDMTPIIFNVGLGATLVAGPSDAWGNNGYAAMTLLDKIGLAVYKYNWKDFRFETGPFAGGFLDALIRTASGDGTAQRYWLLGYTAGFPRMWSTDLGLELHVAAAMPFALTDASHYGFAVGGALVVPFNFVFQQGGQ